MTKPLEDLHSFDDNFQVQIRTRTDSHYLHQTEVRCLGKRRRSGSIDKIETTDARGIGVKFKEQARPIEVRGNADALALVPHSRKVTVIEKEMPQATAHFNVHTQDSELSKVCGESSAIHEVHGVTRGRILSQEAAAAHCKAIDRQSPCIGKSEFSTLVFTSLSDAIEVWEGAGDEKARTSTFNILTSVCKWNEPKKTKGVNYSHLIAHETDMWFQGSDMHVAAKLYSSECNRTIKASFFFDPEYVPKPCLAGEQIRLIGARLQLWKGCLQLTGKNIRFGEPLVSMTLSNAIAAWKYVTGVQPLLFLRKNTTRAQRCFPKLTLIVNVKMWGNATTTTGAPILNIVLTLYYIRFIRVVRW